MSSGALGSVLCPKTHALSSVIHSKVYVRLPLLSGILQQVLPMGRQSAYLPEIIWFAIKTISLSILIVTLIYLILEVSNIMADTDLDNMANIYIYKLGDSRKSNTEATLTYITFDPGVEASKKSCYRLKDQQVMVQTTLMRARIYQRPHRRPLRLASFVFAAIYALIGEPALIIYLFSLWIQRSRYIKATRGFRRVFYRIYRPQEQYVWT